MRHRDIKAQWAAKANRRNEDRPESAAAGSPKPRAEPTPVIDAEVVPAGEKMAGVLSKPNELEELLMKHARDASGLASVVARFERQWIDFTASADARLVPTALGVVAKIDRVRAGLADETMRVAEILHDLPRSRTSFTIRDSAVLVAPARREKDKED